MSWTRPHVTLLAPNHVLGQATLRENKIFRSATYSPKPLLNDESHKVWHVATRTNLLYPHFISASKPKKIS